MEPRRLAEGTALAAVFAAALALYLPWALDPQVGQPPAAVALELTVVLLYALLDLVLVARGAPARHRVAFTLTALAVTATIVFPPLQAWPAGASVVAWAVLHSLVYFANPAPIIHLVALIGRPRLSRGRAVLVALHWLGLTGLALALVPRWNAAAAGAPLEPVLVAANQLLYLYTGVLCLLLLAATARRGESLHARRQAAVVFAGLLPWTALQLLAFAPDVRSSAPLVAIEGAVMLLIPISMFVALAGFRMFGVALPVRKGLVYALTLTVPLFALALVWLALGAALAGVSRLQPTVANIGALLVILLLALRPLAARLVRWTDRLFFPEKVALRRLVRTLIPDLAGHDSLAGVARELVERVAGELGLTGAALLLIDEDAAALRPVVHTGDVELPVLALDDLTRLPPWRTGGAVRLADLRPPGRWTAGLLVPVHLGGRLVGAVAVGEPRGGAGFDAWDVEHLELLAQQASAMLEHARVSELARIDPLTRLPRRAVFDERLQQEMLRSHRTGEPLAVALADVDDFKRVNDRHGHAAGDRTLQLVAAALRSSARATDLVARYGGEEFVVVMPDTAGEGATAALENLRRAVARVRVEVDGSAPLAVTASFGVAVLSGPSDSAHQLVERADAAMYAAKRAGKDRVVLWTADRAAG